MDLQNKPLPLFAKEPCSDTFQTSFSRVGTYSAVTCICGRTHFCSDMYCDDEEDETDLKRMIDSEKTNPDAFISHSREDGISYFHSLDKNVVFACKCNYAGHLENLFLNHQSNILSYIAQVSAKKLKEAEMFNETVVQTANSVAKAKQ